MMRTEAMNLKFAFSIVLFISICSCQGRKEPLASSMAPGKEEMTELNRYLVRKDREIIESYIERKGLKMNESPTGLWYLIENEGAGDLFKG